MRTIIAGSRSAVSEDVWKALEQCGWVPTVVISGTARGADQAGEFWAASYRIPIERYPAAWAKHGRSAGHVRNAEMAAVAEALVAVWDGKSSGTRGMIDEANRRGLRVFVWRIGGAPCP